MWGGKGLECWECQACSHQAKEALLPGLCFSKTHSPDSAPPQGFASTKMKTQNPKAGAGKGSPIEDFTLTSVSMEQRIWKPRMEGNLRSPNPILCLMRESFLLTTSLLNDHQLQLEYVQGEKIYFFQIERARDDVSWRTYYVIPCDKPLRFMILFNATRWGNWGFICCRERI